MSDDMEFIKLHMPKEELPAARPQHLKFCRDLMNQRDWEEMVKGMPDTWWKLFLAIKSGENTFNGKPILRTDVNKLITELKKCQTGKKATAYKQRETAELEDGIYRKADGTIYRIYYNLANTHLLAKRLIIVSKGNKELGKPAKVKWEYAGAANRFVHLSEKMPYEDAKEFGALYGICIFGHPLNDPVSIHLGIGPVCGRRQFGEDFEFMIDQAKVELGRKVSNEDQLAEIEREMKELER